MQRILLSFLSLTLLLSSPAFAREEVLVFAASSMTTALNDIVDQYELETGKKVVVSYASSSALARQLAYGAPADIYISANEKWMAYVVEQGVIEPSAVMPWVRNQLVIVAGRDGKTLDGLNQQDLVAAIGNSRLAMSDPGHVPAGIYAKESLETLGFWGSVKSKLALSNSVRATLALVERGEAPLGIVYFSDANASSQVKIAAEIPANTHAPIVFPKALTKEANAEAEAFFRFLDSDAATKIVTNNGFVVTPKQSNDH
ncbi:molybdenum ABC transporter substrate-binding protein [Grimontia sp. AD028]|uniref:molybdate ABC transporter substrate-binding protein n=1 Tax=Grimontia sp. AD028 TaxID=1581149 RepID=UPI00061AAD57|nr:molybdate ABC transporter substrate-binding protein [Grimontia sp. AD028]KKD59813.1 molybdenum ABC transporter substrate-binding protein [Grimontia sp. AD028]